MSWRELREYTGVTEMLYLFFNQPFSWFFFQQQEIVAYLRRGEQYVAGKGTTFG